MANRIERPISISAVRDCLGVSTNSLKTLCRSELQSGLNISLPE